MRKLFRPSKVALKLAEKSPRMTKGLLRLWIAVDRKPHWLKQRLAESLDCRIPVGAELANGMGIQVFWNDVIGQTICEKGCYEPDSVSLFSSLVKPGMTVLDVGANIGQYTLVAAKLVGPAGQVHSFEPDPETFRLLSKNVARNRLTNVALNRAGVTNHNGTAQLHRALPSHNGGHSLLPPWYLDSGNTTHIDCLTLDGYLTARGLQQVDFIKMDIEGGEIDALAGAQTLLGQPRKPLILLEFHEPSLANFGHSCDKLASVLRGFGYQLFYAGKPPLQPYAGALDSVREFNVLAVPGQQE